MDVLIIHYNTPELTQATVKSVLKHTPSAKITIFDNSDKQPFPIKKFPEIRYIDNTKGQIINWEEWLKKFPDKTKTANNWGSAKHTYSIEICLDYFQEGFILIDSDILIKKDITPFYDLSVPYSGSISSNSKLKLCGLVRLCPFLCFINVSLLKKYNIHYTDDKTLYGLSRVFPYHYYDTGTYFLKECDKHKLKGKMIKLDNYCIHFGHGSWKNKDYKKWLQENKIYYL